MKLNPSGIVTPHEYSLLAETCPSGIVLSTLKKAEKEERLLLRFYNPTDDQAQASFAFNDQGIIPVEAKLSEEPVGELSVHDGTITLDVKRNQVRTVLF